MRKPWIDHCLRLAAEPEDFYAGGCRKIRRGVRLQWPSFEDDLTLEDSGYTKSKMTMLRKNYLHQESIDMAKLLWEKRLGQGKYGSVGFTCYNHFVKGGKLDQAKSIRASVFGPCIQSITMTLMDTGEVGIDVFYRTTELFKKFPADLVFIRDELLSQFELPKYSVTFHFANVTLHPMYFVTILPLIDDPIREFRVLRRADRRYFDWVVKATSRYLLPEHHRGIAKFAQAQRVKMDAERRLGDVPELVAYLRKHHPGHRNAYKETDDDA